MQISSLPLGLAVACLLTTAAAASDGPLLALPEAERTAQVDALLAPTSVKLPGGTTTLAAAVEILSAGGNRVILADGVDERREASLAPFAGAWWDAIRTVCTAFSLRFDEGVFSTDRLDGDGTPLPIGHGALVLSADAGGPPDFTTVGSIAVTSEHETVNAPDGRSLTMRIHARAEPRIPRGRLAWARAGNPRLATADGKSRSVNLTCDAPLNRAPCLVLKTAIGQADPATVSTAFILTTSAVEHWTKDLDLHLGEPADITVDNQEFHVLLRGEAPTVSWHDINLPPQPLLAVVGPLAMVNNCRIHLKADGKEVPLRGGTSFPASNSGTYALLRYMNPLPGGPYSISLASVAAISPRQVPITLDLHHRRLAVDPDLPARLIWPAGSQPLSRWIALLAATGNPILPEVGVDLSTVVALPAFDGTFWDGVLALCRAGDLTPTPTTGFEIGSGPLRLSSRRGVPLIAAACGPLAILADPPEIVKVDAEREMGLRLTLIAEPRLAGTFFMNPAIAWATFAEDPAATPVRITTSLSEHALDAARELAARRNHPNRPEGNLATLFATARIPHPQVQAVTLSGLLMVQRARILTATTAMAAGGRLELAFGRHQVELSALVPGSPLEADGIFGSGIVLRGGFPFENLAITAVNAAGEPIDLDDPSGAANTVGSEPGLRLSRFAAPSNVDLTVELSAREPQPPLSLPLRLVVPLP